MSERLFEHDDLTVTSFAKPGGPQLQFGIGVAVPVQLDREHVRQLAMRLQVWGSFDSQDAAWQRIAAATERIAVIFEAIDAARVKAEEFAAVVEAYPPRSEPFRARKLCAVSDRRCPYCDAQHVTIYARAQDSFGCEKCIGAFLSSRGTS